MNNPTTTTQTIDETSLGVAMESNILKEKMTRAAEKCGSAMLHYYHISGNTGLENKMKYMLKDLLYMKKEEAEYICETIYEEANTHLVAAMKYGYTAKDLAELRNCTDDYRKHIRSQQQGMAGKKNMDGIMQDFAMWRHREA